MSKDYHIIKKKNSDGLVNTHFEWVPENDQPSKSNIDLPPPVAMEIDLCDKSFLHADYVYKIGHYRISIHTLGHQSRVPGDRIYHT